MRGRDWIECWMKTKPITNHSGIWIDEINSMKEAGNTIQINLHSHSQIHSSFVHSVKINWIVLFDGCCWGWLLGCVCLLSAEPMALCALNPPKEQTAQPTPSLSIPSIAAHSGPAIDWSGRETYRGAFGSLGRTPSIQPNQSAPSINQI